MGARCCVALALAIATLAQVSPPALAGIVIGNGSYSVDVAESGVLLAVPPRGFHTVDGPRVDLLPGFAEWFGLAFVGPGPTDGVGVGTAPDWAGRPPVDLVWSGGTGNAATCVTRRGALRITTRFTFDPRAPYLLVAVTLTNDGAIPLRSVFYTREWRVLGERGFTDPSDLPLPPAPPDICRLAWMLDELLPGRSQSVGFSYAPEQAPPAAIDVPLQFWTNADFPSGLPVGATNGVSFGDYDGDGFTDIFACQAGNLWHNVSGQTWQLAANVNGLLPPVQIRYGASFGDYDQNGLQDIGTEPRKVAHQDSCFHLLQNLGNATFVDVATDPDVVIGQPCEADAETLCWADVDGDGDLDAFLPAYPPWALFPGPGNFFLDNRGPVGPADQYVLVESVDQVGLDNPPPDSARPEGAQFCDVDGDGDLDLYSNGTLYQNQSAFRSPRFAPMKEVASGIRFSTELDEGTAFFDYDMDGDYDLVMAYVSGLLGIEIWENQGDGSFFLAEREIIESPFIGLGVGLSAEDWDDDGDIDFSTRAVLRRNLLRETGQRQFAVGQGAIPGSHLTNATPAWGDWDHDGDLDCALGNYLNDGHFYENVRYQGVPLQDRAFLRVRAVRDSATVPRGLETEYGASVRVTVPGEAFARIRFPQSASGYLNQNEYALTFGLEGAPSDDGLARSIRCGVSADFAGIGGAQRTRVDPLVNPVLGGLELGPLIDREVTVYRSGKATVQGVAFTPVPARSPAAITTTRGLALATPETPLLPPVRPTQPDFCVGIELDTLPAATRSLVFELVIDGELELPIDCGGTATNVLVWDVTGQTPVLARNGKLALGTSPRNHRSSLPIALTLDPGRRYRVIARVSEYRMSPMPSGPTGIEPIHVRGGLAFRNDQPCSGQAAASAPVIPMRVPLALRYHVESSPWCNLGHGLAGVHGEPVLVATGDPIPGLPVQYALTGARESAPALAIIGTGAGAQPFLGGVMVPLPEFLVGNLFTLPNGTLTLGETWPDLPVGTSVFFQFWISDPAAPQGMSASNAVAGTTR